MVPIERRRLLQGAVGLVAAAAGCSDTLSHTDSATRSVPRENPPPEELPPHRSIRNPGEGPATWFADEGTPTPSDTLRPHHTRELVATASRAEQLRFADVADADDARSFLADTAFSSETMYVESRPVRECYELSLCDVRWNAEKVETSYGSVLRDAAVTCEAEAHDAVTMLIRIPEALDPERYTGYGSRWSSSPCHRRRPAEPDTTEPPQYGPASPTNATEVDR